jgi:hypothetical protein
MNCRHQFISGGPRKINRFLDYDKELMEAAVAGFHDFMTGTPGARIL